MGHYKTLFLMSVAPGSERRKKATLANLLAGHSSINGVVINQDLIRSSLHNNDITLHRSAELAYNVQWAFAPDLLRQGLNVLIDSTCTYQ